MDEKDIDRIYKNFENCITDLTNAIIALADRKEAVRIMFLVKYETGEIQGSNDDKREASARKVNAQYYDDLARAETEYSRAKMLFDITKAEIDKFKLKLRLMEYILADADRNDKVNQNYENEIKLARGIFDENGDILGLP
jgi:hypothetical protein